ncbi:unnamed protein product [Arctogadus glacialis]
MRTRLKSNYTAIDQRSQAKTLGRSDIDADRLQLSNVHKQIKASGHLGLSPPGPAGGELLVIQPRQTHRKPTATRRPYRDTRGFTKH